MKQDWHLFVRLRVISWIVPFNTRETIHEITEISLENPGN